ncbi:ATP-dependent DNA ligase [Nocardioides sp. GY 10127]|uniref:ATP-dependent DNA ligase n=1 Tax=Nocardioides sp. GY 10127 TaxID=2569762 RepID=UPI0010A858EB|nr:ATP-dependent DNA ligase [Nocardioides sp. GY 10127]TIC86587.1 ATP-dependent DNA ligase [Nocardioides sp. GY 10127]
MLLHEVVETSTQVASTRARHAKRDAMADLLGRTPEGEVEVVASWLGGSLLQRRTGVGWRSLQELPQPADRPSLEVLVVNRTLDALSAVSGPGSVARRTALLGDLLGRATAEEQRWLRSVMTGEVRQGALDAVLIEAAALVADVPAAAVRRAAMMAGSPVTAVVVALRDGLEALDAVGLEVMRPILPMLASSAPDVATGVAKAAGPAQGAVAVDVKLDGIRVQVHRSGEDVRVVTRTLDDITSRLPEVVAVVRALPVTSVVLDGEALLLEADGRPRPFQETSSRTARQGATDLAVTPWFFDVLHVDGEDLHDRPLGERLERLAALVPEAHRVARLVTGDPEAAAAFAREAVAAGHEGVVIKSLGSTYEAGRRGASWVKVKPVHTLDLVVVAVEHGSGRRRGWLSNIHLAARSGDDLVMVGKTFKGMTDEMLAWQTERFRSLETGDDGWVVTVRPEQVVEVAVDGVQRSTRYGGGVALRFARVVRYREDKTPTEADTIETVRSLLA